MMKALIPLLIMVSVSVNAQSVPKFTDEVAGLLAEKPLKCIAQEYPNKTAHIINNSSEATLTPAQLHPSFYGCFDWHSSVHGHWMLVRLLKIKPNLTDRDKIIEILNESFNPQNMMEEAAYFTKYDISQNFERTYGWAWLLKLDEELLTWNHPQAKIWHQNLQPLTTEILRLWKNYLPKQTYPNRTGVHPNSAFAMSFALDWARAAKDAEFEQELIAKSKKFYLKDQKTPAYLEPDGSDFFSPSLEIADLMRRILDQKEFAIWFDNFYDLRSIGNISLIPVISDINDFQTVHLVGLSFSRAWTMKGVAKSLPGNHPMTVQFSKTSDLFLTNALPLLFQGNYGGDHWLASFAVYALSDH